MLPFEAHLLAAGWPRDGPDGECQCLYRKFQSYRLQLRVPSADPPSVIGRCRCMRSQILDLGVMIIHLHRLLLHLHLPLTLRWNAAYRLIEMALLCR